MYESADYLAQIILIFFFICELIKSDARKLVNLMRDKSSI